MRGELLAGSAARELALLAFAVRVGAIVAAFKVSRSEAAARQAPLAGDAGIRVCLPSLVPLWPNGTLRAMLLLEIALEEAGSEEFAIETHRRVFLAAASALDFLRALCSSLNELQAERCGEGAMSP